MRAVLGWSRLDALRRWRSLLVLALLVGLAAGAVMTATAGARRGASAVDRLLAETVPGTVVVQANQPGFDWDPVRALPQVAALAEIVLTDEYVIDEIPPESYVARYPTFGDDAFRTIERPVVLDGRLLDPYRADEVMVGATFRDNFGLGVGDTLTLRLYTPETLDERAFADAATIEPDGPIVEARIVGVVRSPGQLLSGDEGPGAGGGVLTSPQLFEDYAANFIGASGEGIVNAIVRLDGGEEAIPQFKAGLTAVTGRSDIGLWNLAQEARHATDVTAFEADALMAFSLVAGVAAVFLVGQVVVRYAAGTMADSGVLLALGMSPRQSRWAAAVGPTIAATAGAFLSVLALGAIGHALAMAVRRRQHDVAVPQALGMTRGQVRGVVLTQASVLAVVGLVIGIPLGIGLGRVVWRHVAETTPLLYVPPVAVAALLLVPPVVLLAATVLSTRPGRRAASIQVGQVLRAE
jgi:FtsX-like permease family